MFYRRKALLRSEDTNSFHPDHLKIKDDIAQISDMNEAALLSVRRVWALAVYIISSICHISLYAENHCFGVPGACWQSRAIITIAAGFETTIRPE